MAALSRRACGLVLALAACSLLQPAGARSFASPSMGKDVKMNRIGKYESGVVDDGSMEIVAYDAETKTVAVVDASDEGEMSCWKSLTRKHLPATMDHYHR
eukprot:999962-Pelagomonas_calceolata.AAC.2